MKFGNHSLSLGINLEDDCLHAHCVRLSPSKWHTMSQQCYTLNPNLAQNKLEQLTHVLQLLTQDLGQPPSSCILSLPYHRVMMRTVTLIDKLTDTETITYLQHHAERLFGYPATDLAIDYHQLVHQQSRVIRTVACQRSYLETIQQALKKSALNCLAIEIDIYALSRLRKLWQATTHSKPAALLVIQPQRLLCILWQGHWVELVYQITERQNHQAGLSRLAHLLGSHPLAQQLSTLHWLTINTKPDTYAAQLQSLLHMPCQQLTQLAQTISPIALGCALREYQYAN